MSLNITFDGYIYDNNSNLTGGIVKYQALFYPNGTASSSTKWNNVRTCEGTSYYNFNLGDSDFLGQNGVALQNSIVIITYWIGNTTDRNSLCTGATKLEYWSCIEILLTTDSVYSNDIQVLPNINPVVNWSLPSSGYVGTLYTATNNSYDNHDWIFNGNTLHHYKTRYGQNIQLINNIIESYYDWDDSTNNTFSGVSNASHSWSSAGNYDVELKITDECSDFSSDIKSIVIKYNAPVPNIECVQANAFNHIVVPNTMVSFLYTGTDPDNKITSIEWTINDSGLYGNTTTNITDTRDSIVQHVDGLGTSWCGVSNNLTAFTNPGSHDVSIIVHWNDGFEDKTINYSETFIQDTFSGPTVNFNQVPSLATLSSGVAFTNTSTVVDRVGKGKPDCFEYDWYFISAGNIEDNVYNKDYSYIYNIIPTNINSTIGLKANWNDGWLNKTTTKEKDIIFKTTVSVIKEDCYYSLDIIGTSQDGTISGYSWEVYEDTTLSGTGPWNLLWESPTGLDQKTKNIGFTDKGYYKIAGYIYGNGTTSDYDIIYVDEPCEGTCGDEVIWDGTGVLDTPTLWIRSGFGFEAEYAKHSGTNGLDVVGLNTNYISFYNSTGSAFDNFESISFWIKTTNITTGSDIKITINTSTDKSATVYLSNYITIDTINNWKKVLININEFKNISGLITKLIFTGTNIWDFYLDDIIFSKSKLFFKITTVCGTDVDGSSLGDKYLEALELKPQVKAGVNEIEVPVIKGDLFPEPNLS